MTIEHLADLIIVGCFFGILGGAVGNILGRFVCWVVDKVKAWREKRREGKTVTVQGMRKNLKRQIDDLALGGYGSVVRVYKDYSGS